MSEGTFFHVVAYIYVQVWRDNGGGSWNVIATVGGHSHRVSMAAIQPGKEEKMVTSSLDRLVSLVWFKYLRIRAFVVRMKYSGILGYPKC